MRVHVVRVVFVRARCIVDGGMVGLLVAVSAANRFNFSCRVVESGSSRGLAAQKKGTMIMSVLFCIGVALVVWLVAMLCYVLLRWPALVTRLREAWERGEMRTPEGQFKRNPTLAEARKFAGARGEPAVTADPVILDPNREDPLDKRVDSGSLLSHNVPGATPGGVFSRWDRHRIRPKV